MMNALALTGSRDVETAWHMLSLDQVKFLFAEQSSIIALTVSKAWLEVFEALRRSS
jgi:hypothetical protein